MKIGIIAHWMNPNMVEMARLLEERGVRVEVITPEKQLIDLAGVRVKNDLYLIKSGNDLSLSLAGALHELGAATINPYPVVAMMQNKIIATRVLQEAGVPVPETFLAADRKDLAPLLEDGPLIVKPYRGCRGEGIAVVQNAGELDKLTLERTILAQRYYQSDDGCDRKLFCIGGRFFGVRRVFPLRTYADKIGQPFALTPELCTIVQRCGQAVGIDLFGVDVVVSKGRTYVVDINKFCSFIGVADAPRLLAEYVFSAGRRVLHGEPLHSALGAVPSPVIGSGGRMESRGHPAGPLSKWNTPPGATA